MGWGRGAEEAVGMSLEEVAVLGQHTEDKGGMESTKTMGYPSITGLTMYDS